MGPTFASLHTFGKVHLQNIYLFILRILVGMLLGPALLLFFNVLTISRISSSLVGFIEKSIFDLGFQIFHIIFSWK